MPGRATHVNEPMRRVLVLGSSGSGKSTVTRDLARLLTVEPIHLDSYYWQPNWVATPDEAWERKLDQLLQKEEWVMDGNYPSSLVRRLSFADGIVFLDANRLLCLWRCVKRLIQNWGQSREDLGPGCIEKIDWDFLQWIWNYPRDVKPQVLQALKECDGDKQVFILRNNDEIARFFQRVRSEGGVPGPGIPPRNARSGGVPT